MKFTRRATFIAGLSALAMAVALPAMAQDKITILVSMPQPSPFFVHMNNAITAEAEKLGNIELLEVNAGDSTTKQTADVEAAIAKGVAGILIAPREVDGLAPVLTQAIEANIPVVTVDRRVDSVSGILAHIGADNVKGGEAQANLIMQLHPDGARIINLQGVPGSSPAIDRSKGLHNVLDPVADKYPFVFEQTANFARDQGLSITESALGASDTPPDFIAAANDDMALGAAEALAGRDLTGKVGVVGFDALPEAIAAVRDGTLTATIEQMPGKQSALALETLVEFIRDGKKPESELTLLTPIAITKDNLDEAERIGEIQ